MCKMSILKIIFDKYTDSEGVKMSQHPQLLHSDIGNTTQILRIKCDHKPCL